MGGMGQPVHHHEDCDGHDRVEVDRYDRIHHTEVRMIHFLPLYYYWAVVDVDVRGWLVVLGFESEAAAVVD